VYKASGLAVILGVSIDPRRALYSPTDSVMEGLMSFEGPMPCVRVCTL